MAALETAHGIVLVIYSRLDEENRPFAAAMLMLAMRAVIAQLCVADAHLFTEYEAPYQKDVKLSS